MSGGERQVPGQKSDNNRIQEKRKENLENDEREWAYEMKIEDHVYCAICSTSVSIEARLAAFEP